MSRRRPRGEGDWIRTLPADLRTRYERGVLADPRTTAKSARQWLADQGVFVSLASVLRHRRWLAQDDVRRATALAVDEATRRLALEAGLTADELAAGRALRNARLLFEQCHAVFRTVYTRGEPARPAQLLALANAVRAMAR
jgi:hypothetical protein